MAYSFGEERRLTGFMAEVTPKTWAMVETAFINSGGAAAHMRHAVKELGLTLTYRAWDLGPLDWPKERRSLSVAVMEGKTINGGRFVKHLVSVGAHNELPCDQEPAACVQLKN